MAKKWTIREGEPLKVRVVGMTENDSNKDTIRSRAPRVRVLSRIAKVLVGLGLLSIGSWMQSCAQSTGDGVHKAIDGDTNPFDIM